jgi:glyoxylase-like metal-dependent hydrolase (beta-lactamase superfamily II)
MIETTTFGDVTRLRFWTWRTLAVGYDVSCYLTRGVLIDTAFRHVGPELRAALRELGPAGVIVTHWHEDHAGNAPDLAQLGTPMWMHQYTEAKLRERQQVKLYRHFTWGRPRALRNAVRAFDPAPLRVIHTPGHSTDHHVVFDEESRTLFSADLWLGVKVRIMGATENPYQIVESLTRAIALEPKRMFDAHRGHVENPVDALAAKRAWLQETIGEIQRRIDAGQTEDAILRELLGGEERTALASQGEYSRRNLIRTVRQHRPSG